MKRTVFPLTLIALASAFFLGCASETSQTVLTTPTSASAIDGATSGILCGKCGHDKGSSECCKEDSEMCASCNLHKESVLCCKLTGDFAGKDFCAKCGQVAEGEHSCEEGAEVCAKCNLHKGSPLCCKGLTSTETHESTEG